MLKKRFQFRLRTALLVVTVAAVLLATRSVLPPRLLQLVIAVLTFLAGATILFFVFWLVDERITGKALRRSYPIGSMMLASVSTLIIVLATLPLSGSRGPVQYAAGNDFAMFFFTMRVVAFLVLLVSPFICGLIGVARLGVGNRPRFGWLVAANASHVLAWYVVFSQGFFPTV
jgi:hypothetical protein